MNNEQVTLLWKKSVFKNYSLAKINRNICKQLLEHHEINLTISSSGSEPSPLEQKENFTSMKKSDATIDTDITVCLQWPPNWTVPSSKCWVCMQTWEFAAIPKQWYSPMTDQVNEIWVYSKYMKDCYVQCGIPEDKIKVIPLGVDEVIYHYDVKPLDMKDNALFNFLIVGGSMDNEIADTLIQAYQQEFSSDDTVQLIIIDVETNTIYKEFTSNKPNSDHASDYSQPHILYLNQHFSEQEMASLYKACNCLVYPYLGEGFGLPIIEAMACGLPAIVPNLGPSQDFCDSDTAFLLSCKEESLIQKQVGHLETVDNPMGLKIDQSELQKMMRFVYENHAEVKKKGKKASEKILSAFTWKHTVNVICNRVNQLVHDNNVSTVDDKRDYYIQLIYGIQLFKDKQYKNAIKLFLYILSKYPDSLETRYNTAIVYMKINDYAEAIKHLITITNTMENATKAFQANAWSLLGICYSQIKSFPTAIDAFQKASTINPSLRSQELSCLKKCIQATTESSFELYHELGDCYFELGNDFHAEEMYMKALEYGGNQPTIKALMQVYERIQSMKTRIMLIHTKSLPTKPLQDHSITWQQSSSYPLEDSEEIIHERRMRWEHYFVNGNRILEIQWSSQTTLDTSQAEPLFDGIFLLIREKSISAINLLHMLKYCFKWINHSGKIIIYIESPDKTAVPISFKKMVETILNSAGWTVKETNAQENKDSFYIISQKTSYEVLWQSPLFNLSGYAQEQKLFLDGIRPYPLRVKVNPLDSAPSLDLYTSDMKAYLLPLQNQQIKSPLIHYQAAPVTFFSHPTAPISIGRTMFETNSLPSNWVDILNEMTEVWVPSVFNLETFASAGVKLDRMRIIPGTLDDIKYHPLNVLPYPFELVGAGTFKFLSVFDWSIRKGWDILLQAYFEEFRKEDDVSLILKVTKINEPNTNPYQIIKDLNKKLGLKKLPHIHIIQDNLSEEAMIRLYAAVDCFVLPSRGEGWGRPYMEAMAMELPTIGTKWGGQQSFMNDDNSYLINIEGLVPVNPNEMPEHFHGHKWAEPSIEHLRALMRYVYNNPVESKKKGKEARKDLFPRFSKHTIGQQIYQSIDELVKNHYL